MEQYDRVFWTCDDWKAVHDHMPGPDKTPSLRVSGICTFPTSGWQVSLDVGNQGINPDPEKLLLILKVVAPQGIVAEVVTEKTAEFTLETGQEYRIVGVGPGPIATIEVEHVD